MAAHGRSLLRLAYSYTNDRGAAEDIVQETFWRLWQHRRQRPWASVRPGWVYTVAYHLAVDHARRQREPVVAMRDSDAGSPDDVDRRLLVATVLEDLPARTREFLWLFYWAGWSPAEIGRRYRITPAAVRDRLFRARRQFRALWHENEEDDPHASSR